MARYIDADKLIAEYDRVHIGPAGGARKLMVEAPTADVAEVKHGEWDGSGRYKFADGSLAIRCTVCGCALHSDEYEKYHWNYCPNCGAQMDGGKAE